MKIVLLVVLCCISLFRTVESQQWKNLTKLPTMTIWGTNFSAEVPAVGYYAAANRIYVLSTTIGGFFDVDAQVFGAFSPTSTYGYGFAQTAVLNQYLFYHHSNSLHRFNMLTHTLTSYSHSAPSTILSVCLSTDESTLYLHSGAKFGRILLSNLTKFVSLSTTSMISRDYPCLFQHGDWVYSMGGDQSTPQRFNVINESWSSFTISGTNIPVSTGARCVKVGVGYYFNFHGAVTYFNPQTLTGTAVTITGYPTAYTFYYYGVAYAHNYIYTVGGAYGGFSIIQKSNFINNNSGIHV